jgi:hypothetical protein
MQDALTPVRRLRYNSLRIPWAIPATFGSRTKLMKHMPRAPPTKQRIGERSKRRTISTPLSGMRSSKATAKTPTSWKRLVMLDPLIFPMMIA